MPKYKNTNATAKVGVNFIRDIVESANCIFHKIEQENDIGIDAIVELIRDEKPLHEQIAIQIKSGDSYYNPKKNECIIPVGDHAEYWSKYRLPVLGIVMIPSLSRAHWVDLKKVLGATTRVTQIKFNATQANSFSAQSFSEIFLPAMIREVPKLSLDKALEMFHSEHEDELWLGMTVLFRRYCNEMKTWDAYVEFFWKRPLEEIPAILIYYFAHVPWHGDIWGHGEELTSETKVYIRAKFERFKFQEVVKLLSFIDEDNGISRGSIGQSVEAIISSLNGRDELLQEIVNDEAVSLDIRGSGALILAMHIPDVAIPILEVLSSEGLSWGDEFISVIKECGGYYPY